MTNPRIHPGVEKASLYDQAGQSADTNLLSSNVTASDPPSTLTLTLAVSNTTSIKWAEWDGSTQKTYNLNGNTSLDANDLHSFDIPSRPGSEYNVQLHSATDVALLHIAESQLDRG